jgi:PAS domain S-box-containing protein
VARFDCLFRNSRHTMSDFSRTQVDLVAELARLRRRVSELEAAASSHDPDAATLRAALNAAANAIVITDRTGIILWVNPAFCEITGYTAEEAAGRNPSERVKSGQHDPEFYRDLWETILAGRVWHGEVINRRKDGSLYTEEQSVTPVRDAQGEITHFIAVKQDVTARKHAEADLAARAQLSAVRAAIGLSLTQAESLPQALRECVEALVTHLGAALARIWTVNEGSGLLELQASAGLYTHPEGPRRRVPPEHFASARIAKDRVPHMTNAVLGDPLVHNQEWARREGMVSFAGHPLMLNDRVVGVMALFARHALPDAVMAGLASVADHVALGIERHRGADALHTAEERMRFALQSANIGIWELDYATGVLLWSETMAVHYGLQPVPLRGSVDAFLERVHPDDREILRQTEARARKTGSDFSVDLRSVRPDGAVRWLRGGGRIFLDDGGRPVRGLGISIDVTERRALEAQFQQAQKMEAIGRLAGGIAHDFNNLLTAILGYCDLLVDDFQPGDRHRQDLEEIQKAGNRAAGLTRQLLAFSRKQIIEPKVLDLKTVVSDMQPMLVRLIGEDIRVTLHLEPELVPVRADRGQVEQIVMNLVVNARDAMPNGGTLTIATGRVELDEHYAATHADVTPGSYVALTVSDTGTGMTPAVQARLFEPFFTTKGVGKGTGLGLATVHGIVKQNGGSIGVYTEVGKGSSVHVYFPLAEAAEIAAEPAPPAARPRTHTETVLIVEDADELRDLARRLLERQGYTVLVAANADEAQRLFTAHPAIDLVVTDVVMPGASGPELTRRLAERRPALKVLYMSGYTEDAIAHHGVIDPGIAFLHKPFTAETLGRKVRDLLDG